MNAFPIGSGTKCCSRCIGLSQTFFMKAMKGGPSMRRSYIALGCHIVHAFTSFGPWRRPPACCQICSRGLWRLHPLCRVLLLCVRSTSSGTGWRHWWNSSTKWSQLLRQAIRSCQARRRRSPIIDICFTVSLFLLPMTATESRCRLGTTRLSVLDNVIEFQPGHHCSHTPSVTSPIAVRSRLSYVAAALSCSDCCVARSLVFPVSELASLFLSVCCWLH